MRSRRLTQPVALVWAGALAVPDAMADATMGGAGPIPDVRHGDQKERHPGEEVPYSPSATIASDVLTAALTHRVRTRVAAAVGVRSRGARMSRRSDTARVDVDSGRCGNRRCARRDAARHSPR